MQLVLEHVVEFLDHVGVELLLVVTSRTVAARALGESCVGVDFSLARGSSRRTSDVGTACSNMALCGKKPSSVPELARRRLPMLMSGPSAGIVGLTGPEAGRNHDQISERSGVGVGIGLDVRRDPRLVDSGMTRELGTTWLIFIPTVCSIRWAEDLLHRIG